MESLAADPFACIWQHIDSNRVLLNVTMSTHSQRTQRTFRNLLFIHVSSHLFAYTVSLAIIRFPDIADFYDEIWMGQSLYKLRHKLSCLAVVASIRPPSGSEKPLLLTCRLSSDRMIDSNETDLKCQRPHFQQRTTMTSRFATDNLSICLLSAKELLTLTFCLFNSYTVGQPSLQILINPIFFICTKINVFIIILYMTIVIYL